MAPQLAGHAHGVEIPHDAGAVDAARSQVAAIAIEAQAGRVAGTDRIGDVLGVILQEVIVRQEEIHIDAVMALLSKLALRGKLEKRARWPICVSSARKEKKRQPCLRRLTSRRSARLRRPLTA